MYISIWLKNSYKSLKFLLTLQLSTTNILNYLNSNNFESNQVTKFKFIS